MVNPDLQELEVQSIGLDSVDVELDPNYRDFINGQCLPCIEKVREKLEQIWGDENDI